MSFKQGLVIIFSISLICIFTTSGCIRKKKKAVRLQEFNSALWIQDKNGCKGNRNGLKNQFLSLKHHMRGLKTGDIEKYPR